jgi:hypothetical protein
MPTVVEVCRELSLDADTTVHEITVILLADSSCSPEVFFQWDEEGPVLLGKLGGLAWICLIVPFTVKKLYLPF